MTLATHSKNLCTHPSRARSHQRYPSLYQTLAQQAQQGTAESGQDAALNQMLAHAYRLQEIQKVLRKILPANLKDVCQVANLEDNCLTLFLSKAAALPLLRRCAFNVSAQLAQAGLIQATARLQFKIRPSIKPTQAKLPPQPKNLSVCAQASLHQMHTQAQDPVLKEALARILERAQASKGEPKETGA
ncbi:hypothetical protein SAMN05421831_101307 [Allopseudospirillum japonicum]|uniref:DUF721 domain-containing protein n=1 Tax=Allopseudospirillum japonicum TaxID=64971 RepID=A0A1H6QMS2_9GAMM|nr:DciA family protein [Allopseudospirillum japonicum]SEI40302.1 hypothetical protein SAMN05421831_101307 [Allopseudospirillum japonicum]